MNYTENLHYKHKKGIRKLTETAAKTARPKARAIRTRLGAAVGPWLTFTHAPHPNKFSRTFPEDSPNYDKSYKAEACIGFRQTRKYRPK
jgi:hypothetical protein